MKIGINHQILPGSNPEFYTQFWNAITPWVNLIRLDPHMNAYAWRVDPNTVYVDKTNPAITSTPMDNFANIGKACKAANISIDFIRDGASASPQWQALGGDWSSFEAPNTWHNHQLPKVAWSKTNTWLNAAAKKLVSTGASLRWQNSNEQFYRNKDQWAYERMRSVYAQPSYSKKWTSPALWGPRPQLLKTLDEWLVMSHYDVTLKKAEWVAVNVYPDYTPGVTINTSTNVKRQVENLVLVHNWATLNNKKIVIPEFGFETVQVPEGEQRRVELTAFVYQCAKLLDTIDTMTLYWDSNTYFLSPTALAKLGALVNEPVSDEVVAYVADIQKALAKSPLPATTL